MAGGFDLMRFQKCSETLIPELRRNAKWIVFWAFACIVFFFGLGIYPAIRSEARWFEVVREMLMTGDWLHPRINGQPYFDKPLVSYWFAAIVSKLAGGHVTELSVRLPSTLFALAGLACIVSVARKFYSERTAYLAGWLLLSTYSYICWGRLAEADMEQTVFIVMAVTMYLHHRETASFWAYFAFWGCCAVGAQTKGLPAFIIPPSLVLIDCFIRKSFRRHLNWKFFLALFLGGLCLYAVPFVLEAVMSENYGASGIVLVFRENLMRVFNPWDHNKDPFYIYFLYLPRLLIPWTPFFLFAVIDYVRDLIRAAAKQGTASVEDLSSRREQGSKDTLWLFASMVFIFVLFSASRSRRSYYILPIVPWCILFTAAWFSEPRESWTLLRKIADRFLRIVDVLTPAAAILLILFAVLAPVDCLIETYGMASGQHGFYLSSLIPIETVELFKLVLFVLAPFALVSGIFWLIVWFRSRKKLGREGADGVFAPAADPLNRIVPFVALILFSVFSFLIPELSRLESCEPTAPFLRENGMLLKGILARDPGFKDRVAFFGATNGAELAYYLDLPAPARMFSLEKLDDTNRTFTSDTVDIQGPDEFRAFLKDVEERGGMVITRGDWVDAIKEYENPSPDEAWLNPHPLWERMSRLHTDVSPVSEPHRRTLDRLEGTPGAQTNEKIRRKIKKLRGKCVWIFYHIPESIAKPAEADGTEGTTQL